MAQLKVPLPPHPKSLRKLRKTPVWLSYIRNQQRGAGRKESSAQSQTVSRCEELKSSWGSGTAGSGRSE